MMKRLEKVSPRCRLGMKRKCNFRVFVCSCFSLIHDLPYSTPPQWKEKKKPKCLIWFELNV